MTHTPEANAALDLPQPVGGVIVCEAAQHKRLVRLQAHRTHFYTSGTINAAMKASFPPTGMQRHTMRTG